MKSTGASSISTAPWVWHPGSVALPSSANTGPMGNAMISKDMSQVGGRGDLGIMPIWNARYLASQNEQAEKTMLANADAAGSIPWHYRDEATGNTCGSTTIQTCGWTAGPTGRSSATTA